MDPLKSLDRILFGEAASASGTIHPATLSEDELMRECRLERDRSGGPGGQHRNKTSTHVTLTHLPTGLDAQAGEQRSSEANRKRALRRLRLILATEHRAAVPAGDCRSDLWKARVRKGRIVCNPAHVDYPALLALALDVIEASGGDVRRAATRLETTPSQLVKLIKDHPPALLALNRLRERRGMGELK